MSRKGGDLLMSNRNLVLLYLNCCSTPSMAVWQSRQVKVPDTSSGWVRITWPNITIEREARLPPAPRSW